VTFCLKLLSPFHITHRSQNPRNCRLKRFVTYVPCVCLVTSRCKMCNFSVKRKLNFSYVYKLRGIWKCWELELKASESRLWCADQPFKNGTSQLSEGSHLDTLVLQFTFLGYVAVISVFSCSSSCSCSCSSLSCCSLCYLSCSCSCSCFRSRSPCSCPCSPLT
jgi:hypothetical protein